MPALHSQINLGNDVLYNLLDYGIDNLEPLSQEEQAARNSHMAVDSAIELKVNERNEWDASDKGKNLKTLKNQRRRDLTSMTEETTDEQMNREEKIN